MQQNFTIVQEWTVSKVMVTVTEVLTVTVPLLLARVNWEIPVLGNVPTRLEVLALILTLLIQHLAHLRKDLAVRSALHRQHLALVIVA